MSEMTIADTEPTGLDVATKIQAVKSQLDHTQAGSIALFGTENQRKLGQFSDDMLKRVKGQDAGFLGGAVTELLNQIRRIDVEEVQERSGFQRLLGMLPGYKKIADRGKALVSRFESVSENLDDIAQQMTKGQVTLLKDSTSLDVMYAKQVGYVQDIGTDIAGGKAKVKELRETTIPELKAKIESSEEVDELELQQLNDIVRYADLLDKKVAELSVSKTLAVQTLPQIRIIQDRNATLSNKIQSAIYNTIPVWRNQVVLALKLENQRKATDMMTVFADSTNAMLVKNSELLKTNSIAIATQSETTTISVESLKTINTNLVATLDEVMKIQEQGQRDRAQLEGQLTRIEGEVRDKVFKVAASSANLAKQLS